MRPGHWAARNNRDWQEGNERSQTAAEEVGKAEDDGERVGAPRDT